MARLLLVDDDEGVLDYFKKVVAMMGHASVCADNGPEALAILERDTDIDIIMTDLHMPGTPSKMDLVRAIRSRKPNTPIIVVSGYPSQEHLDACEALGITDFLSKPFEMSFFNQVIDRLLAEQGKS